MISFLKKLSFYGIEGKLYQWLASFLEGRTQSVIVAGFFSYSSIVLSGVPQGTVLGPIMFLLFINDIELAVSHSKIRCFVDDSRLFKSIQTTSDAELLQDDLNEVIVWAGKITCLSTEISLSSCSIILLHVILIPL